MRSHPAGGRVAGPLALAGCAAPPRPRRPRPSRRGITARGIGTVSSRPDTLTIGIGVQTRGRVAQEALDANSRLATSTIDALRAAGVAEADLRTSQLSVSPTQDPNTGRITGYEVSNLLTATLRDVDRAGSVIDAAGAAAGDAVRVQQLEFSVADDSAPRAQARADAVRKAAGAGPAAGRGGRRDPRPGPLDHRDRGRTSPTPYAAGLRRGPGRRADPPRNTGAAGRPWRSSTRSGNRPGRCRRQAAQPAVGAGHHTSTARPAGPRSRGAVADQPGMGVAGRAHRRSSPAGSHCSACRRPRCSAGSSRRPGSRWPGGRRSAVPAPVNVAAMAVIGVVIGAIARPETLTALAGDTVPVLLVGVATLVVSMAAGLLMGLRPRTCRH